MTYEPVWGVSIIWYLFLAGLGAGVFTTAFFLARKVPDAVKSRKAARLIAPVVVAVGLLLLMVDAQAGFHNPLRFALLLGNFHSVMTWGVVFLSLFMVVAIVALILDWTRRKVPAWLDITGVVISVCVAMYTGALLGVCHLYPLWNSALLPVLFLVSALSTGAAMVLLVSALAYKDEFNSMELLKKVHFYAPIVELLLVASLLFITSSNTVSGWNSVFSLVSGSFAIPFWLGLVVVGLVLPTVVEGALMRRTSGMSAQTSVRAAGAVADACILFGGFMLRFLIVLAAFPIIVP
jgi:polysulfide reductase chain C